MEPNVKNKDGSWTLSDDYKAYRADGGELDPSEFNTVIWLQEVE